MSKNPFDSIGIDDILNESAADKGKSSNPFDSVGLSDIGIDVGTPTSKPTGRTFGDWGRDIAGTALDAAVSAGETVVGIPSLLTGGTVGKGFQNLGVDFKRTHDIINNEIMSDATRAARKKVAEAGEGKDQSFVSSMWDKTKAAVENPSTIVTSTAASIPSMILGGELGSVALKAAPKALGWAAGKMGTSAEGVAGALGEGIVTGGQNAEQVRQETADGTLTLGQSAILAGSGMLTGGISLIGNRIAKKLGITDIDELMVRAASHDPAVSEAAKGTVKHWTRRMVEGAISEGVLEELPQSIQEQVAQNMAQGKDLMDGVSEQAAMGMLSGMTLGGYAGIRSGRKEPEVKDPNGANTPTPRGPSVSSQMARAAFSGDAATTGNSQQALLALALNQMDDNERSQAITHLAQGDDALAGVLAKASTDEQLLNQGRQLLQSPEAMIDGSEHGNGWIKFNEQLRQDAGGNQGVDDPSSTEISTAVNGALAAQNQQANGAVAQNMSQQPNGAGFISEPMSDIHAQVAAVKAGQKPAVFMSEEQANQADLNGLHQAVVVDSEGNQGVIASRDQGIVQQAAARAQQVGLKQAAGEALGYASPTSTANPQPGSVAVQHVDQSGNVINEQLANTPEEVAAAHAQAPNGTTTRVLPTEHALAERQALADAERAAQQSGSSSEAPDVGAGPSFRSKKPTAVPTAKVTVNQGYTTPQSVTRSKDQTQVQRLVVAHNANAEGDNRIDHNSIVQVDLPKNHKLNRMAKAIKRAFGTNVVFATFPQGGLMRVDGKQHSSFNGIAIRDKGKSTIIVNVASTHPILNLLGHELAHVLQVESPQLYRLLEIAVMARMTHSRALRHRNDLMAQLSREGNTGGYSEKVQEIRDELVAEGVGEMAEDETFWSDLFMQIGEDGSTARTIYNKVMSVLTKLAQAITGGGYIEGLSNLKAVRRAVTEAYLGWSRQYETEINSLHNYNKESQAQIREDQKTIDKTEKQLAREEKAAPAANTQTDELTPNENGLIRMSRTAIRAVANGNQIAPIEVMDKPTISLAKTGLRLGFPIKMEASVVQKLLTGKDGLRRKMTEDEILDLPQLIQNPVAIFDDPTEKDSAVVLTAANMDGDPVIVAINRKTLSGTYSVDRVDNLGRKISGGTTQKESQFYPLKTAFSKDAMKMIAWVNKVRVTHFDPGLAAAAYGPEAKLLINALDAKSMKDKAYRVKETGGKQPLDLTPSVSPPSGPTLKQGFSEPVRVPPVQESVTTKVPGRNTLTLRKSRNFGDTPMSTAGLMQMDDVHARASLGLRPDGKAATLNKVRLIGERLNASAKAMFGTIDPKDRSYASAHKLGNAIADEVLYQLTTTSETGSGLGWYSNNYPKAVERLSSRFPELKTNEGARNMFTMLVAVTSNGEKVEKNIDNAIKLYSDYRDGKPLVAMGNRRATALEKNLARIEGLVNRYGIGGIKEQLLKETTVKEMNKALSAMGEKTDSSYTADTVVPNAAIYFGPKLGAFYANLSGSEGYLTMDLWWSRSVNRMRGQLVPSATEGSIKTLRELIGDPNMTRQQVVEASKPYAEQYKKYNYVTAAEYMMGSKASKYPGGPAAWESDLEKKFPNEAEALLYEHKLEKASNNIYKPEYLELEEAPFNAGDRSFMYAAARHAQKVIADEGIKLSLADIQAALWYYEKRLYQKLSGRKADDIGYEEALIARADEAGGREKPSVRFAGGEDSNNDAGGGLPVPAEADRPNREPAPEEGLTPAKDALRMSRQSDDKVAAENLEKALALAQSWQEKLGHRIEVVMGGSLVSGTFVQVGNEAVDMDVRFLAEDPSLHVKDIEAVTGLKLRKEIMASDFPIGSSKAYMIEGEIVHDGVRFDVEGSLRNRNYVGWQNFYRQVFTPEELNQFKKDKERLKSGDKKIYKARKNAMLKMAQARAIARGLVEDRKYDIPKEWKMSDNGKVYIDGKGYERGMGLNSLERFAEQSLYDDWTEDKTGVMIKYVIDNGTIVDADLAKELSDIYAESPKYANAVHEPSSLISKTLWDHILEQSASDVAIFTAGGPSSGKTVTGQFAAKVLSLPADAPVFDSSLTSFEAAVRTINKTLATGRRVYINYTNRNVADAFSGSMKRPRKMRLPLILSNHLRAAETIRKLSEYYKNNNEVVLSVFNADPENENPELKATFGSFDEIPTYDYNEEYNRLKGILNETRSRGAITSDEYAFISGQEAPTAVVGNDGQGAENGSEANAGRDRGGSGQDQARQGDSDANAGRNQSQPGATQRFSRVFEELKGGQESNNPRDWGRTESNPIESNRQAKLAAEAVGRNRKRVGKCHELAVRKVVFDSLGTNADLSQVLAVALGAPDTYIWHSMVLDNRTGNVWEPIMDRWFTPQAAADTFGFKPVKVLPEREVRDLALNSGYYPDQTVLKPRGWEKDYMREGDFDTVPLQPQRSLSGVPVEIDMGVGKIKIKDAKDTIDTLESKISKYQELISCLG